MTCAGCDDCPQDTWHLHVTVKPHWSWTFVDTTEALRQTIERHGIRPIVVTNHFRDNKRKPYKELIPTKHYRGSEAAASREIFKMGVLLNNAGWRVKRLKIEGDAHVVTPGRALYYEAHVKNPVNELPGVPHSTNAKGDRIFTVRHPAMGHVYEGALRLHSYNPIFGKPPPPVRIEAAVLDTAPERDHDWINQ